MMEYLNMQGMTAGELRATLKADPKGFIQSFMQELGIENSDFSYTYREKHEINGFSLKVVHREGGGEGEGEHVERVIAVVENGQELAHFRITGYYDSYYGIEWNGGFEIVYPRVVMVTQYFTEE